MGAGNGSANGSASSVGFGGMGGATAGGAPVGGASSIFGSAIALRTSSANLVRFSSSAGGKPASSHRDRLGFGDSANRLPTPGVSPAQRAASFKPAFASPGIANAAASAVS